MSNSSSNDLNKLVAEFFTNMAEEKIDASEPLKWVYCFYGVKRGNVFFAGEEMKEYGYAVSDIFIDEEETEVFRIEACKEELMGVNELVDRVEQLTELADDFGIFFDRFEIDLENDPLTT